MQQSLNDLEQLLTFKEAMKYLRVSRSTLLRMLDNGLIPKRKVGNTHRFLPSELRAAVREVKPAEQGEQS